MTQYAKSYDQVIEVVDAKGNSQSVTQRAFDIIYSGRGYKLASDNQNTQSEADDFSTFSRSKLEGVKNEDLEAYLDSKGIPYEEGAIKKDLINAILGE